jgi:hypothetical protein
VKLVYTLRSGRSGLTPVEVQVLSSPPKIEFHIDHAIIILNMLDRLKFWVTESLPPVPELSTEYEPGHFVAILGGKAIAGACSYEELHAKIIDLGLQSGDVGVYQIPDQDVDYFLHTAD